MVACWTGAGTGVLFNSYIFWCFFAVVIGLYRVLSWRGQNRMLLAASLVFYGFWDWRFLFLLVFSALVDYALGLRIAAATDPRRKQACVALSVGVGLGLLGVFKYYDFFAANLGRLLHVLGFSAGPPLLGLILPVGISFYTFQSMSYAIDIYRGTLRPTRNVLDYLLYVSFFPQLVAGPIERASSLLPQVLQPRRRAPEDFTLGLYYVLLGLFCKVVVADNMAPVANTVFGLDPAELSGGDCLVGVYAFAFQIYGDFAGYSLMALGLARWMGFRLTVNFRSPYFAVSPSDFWSRWHVSLSSWLRDYLYIPLGGNRRGVGRTYRNLMLTMLLGGLWHGANWTFVAWGAYHGALLIVYRLLGDRAGAHASGRLPGWRPALQALLMFHLVCMSWLLFRADNLRQAGAMLLKIVTDLKPTPLAVYGLGNLAFFAGPLLALELWLGVTGDPLRVIKVAWYWRAGLYAYAVLMLLLFAPLAHHEFIYFQF